MSKDAKQIDVETRKKDGCLTKKQVDKKKDANVTPTNEQKNVKENCQIYLNGIINQF